MLSFAPKSRKAIFKDSLIVTNALHLSVAWQDERFTSKMASKALVDMNVRKSVRQNRSVIDEVSATLILQSYFDSRL